MKTLYQAYQCEFTGRVCLTREEAFECEFEAATKLIGAIKGPGELRADLKSKPTSDPLWRAINLLSDRQHEIAPVPAKSIDQPTAQDWSA